MTDRGQTDRAMRSWLHRSALKRTHGLLRRAARAADGLGLEKIGSDYGGWIVPTALVERDWICYSGGAGEDITFDVVLAERFGCSVRIFDPTPRAIDHVTPILEGRPRLSFMPVGLWSADTTLRFYAPQDPTHVSHSVMNLQQTGDYFEADCRSIPSLMRELDDHKLDLVKLDIEGAEHEVVADILAAGVRPRVICLEIDQPVSVRRIWGTCLGVQRNGYRLVALDSWNLTFVRTVD